MPITLSPRCSAILLSLTVAACSAFPPTETASARSVRATLASQIAHPEAVRNTNPVYGLDGAAALAAQQKYEKSFSKQSADGDTTAPLVQHR
ncbi:hypothetical protein [Massilia sp. DWR3-1-1]|uniref:hypothetical protein n=1 Tax=Massilia sp. DWR3-1-1 TaxID=2804559 RepID=UPI003CFA66D9